MMLCLFHFLFPDISADYLQIIVHTSACIITNAKKALEGDISSRQQTATENHLKYGEEK